MVTETANAALLKKPMAIHVNAMNQPAVSNPAAAPRTGANEIGHSHSSLAAFAVPVLFGLIRPWRFACKGSGFESPHLHNLRARFVLGTAGFRKAG
jgi:hypothetical protein